MYEYRQTYYRVDEQGNEHEHNERRTSDNLKPLITEAQKLVNAFYVNEAYKVWDLLTVEIRELAEYSERRDIKFHASLYAEDFKN